MQNKNMLDQIKKQNKIKNVTFGVLVEHKYIYNMSWCRKHVI